MSVLSLKVKGLNEVVSGMGNFRLASASGVENGLKKAGLQLLRDANELVPVEFGNLKQSGFVRSTGSGFGTVVTVGYTANYAIYVHEIRRRQDGVLVTHGMDFNIKHAQYKKGKLVMQRGPKQQWKFLETPLKQNKEVYFDIIAREALK